MVWVMEEAPTTDPVSLLVLYALADRASDDGSAAYPSQEWIATRARCSVRTVRRKLSELETSGLIRKGNPQYVDHIRKDRRPTVWNLNLQATTTGRSYVPPQNPTTGHRDPGGQNDRADTPGITTGHTVHHDRTNNAPRPDTAMSYEPSRTTLNPKEPIYDQIQHAHQQKVTPTPPPKNEKEKYPQQFETWWKTYPRKVAKPKALTAWKSALKRTNEQTLTEATQRFAQHHKQAHTEPRFIPHPTTWLNRDGWNDELPQAPNATTAPGRLSNAEVARQLQAKNQQDAFAQQRELSNAEAMQAWLNNNTPKAIGF